MKIKDFPSRAALITHLADVIQNDLRAAVATTGKASLAVPGGSTPGPVFDELSTADLDWRKVTILPGDERWVPETSEHSNAAQIKSRLLQNNARAAGFLALFNGGNGPDAVSTLTGSLAGHLPLSVVFLGMGGDMHTASLFPGDEVLASNTKAPLHYVPVPGLDPKVPRMTLTPSSINAAGAKYLVIFGSGKKEALAKAEALADPVAAPIWAVRKNLNVLWAA